MNEPRECTTCGEPFEPDVPSRKLCRGCRDYGYRKTKLAGIPIRRTIWKTSHAARS